MVLLAVAVEARRRSTSKGEGQEFEPEPEEPEPEPLSKPTEEERFRVSDPSGGCKVVCESGGVCLIDCETCCEAMRMRGRGA